MARKQQERYHIQHESEIIDPRGRLVEERDWASTWEMMKRTLETFATRNKTHLTEAVANPGKPSKNPKISRTIQMVALTPG